MRRIGENRKLRLKNVMKWTDQVHGPYLPHIRGISEEKNTIVIILIFVSWLIIATDVLLLLLYFMFPISWDYCIPGSLHCFIFFLIIFCFTTPFLPFFFLCFCQFLFFVYLLFQIGTKEMDWCTLSLVLSLQSPTFWQKGNSCAQPTSCAWWYQPGQS